MSACWAYLFGVSQTRVLEDPSFPASLSNLSSVKLLHAVLSHRQRRLVRNQNVVMANNTLDVDSVAD